MASDLFCSKHGHHVPCFTCVKLGLDEIPLTKAGMTADECLALIERDRDALRAENARLMGLVGEAMKDIERMKPVYEAAVEWRKTMDWSASRAHQEVFTTEVALVAAIDATLSTPKEPSHG